MRRWHARIGGPRHEDGLDMMTHADPRKGEAATSAPLAS